MHTALEQVQRDLTNALKANQQGFCVLSIYWTSKHRAAVKAFLKANGYTDYETGMAPIGYPYAYYYLVPRPWYKRFISALLRPFAIY